MSRAFNIGSKQYVMDLAAIDRIEQAFGKSSLQVIQHLRKTWMVTEGDKASLRGNLIRLGDAYRLIGAAIDQPPEEVSETLAGPDLYNATLETLTVFGDQVGHLLRGMEVPAKGEDADPNPSPAADAATSGG